MTPTQIARRSDALYADGTCGMTRRVLCDMVAQRESDIEDARAENAKLRDERDGWKKLCVDQEVMRFRREETLDNENTKLRELARAAWKCIHTGASCSDCRLIAGGCTLQSTMRELGIEVTE